MTINRLIFLFVFLGVILYLMFPESNAVKNIGGWKLKGERGEAKLLASSQEVDVRQHGGRPPEQYRYSFFLKCSAGKMAFYTSSNFIVKSEYSPEITLKVGHAYLRLPPKGINSAEFKLINSDDARFNNLISEMKKSKELQIGFGDLITLNNVDANFPLNNFSQVYDEFEGKCHVS